MAKQRASIESPFRRTEPRAADTVPAQGRTLPVGVGLKESEIQMLDTIAADHGVSRNQLLRFAVRSFLQDYVAGQVELDVTTEQKRSLNMP
jgi:hypothetical protein